MGLVVVEIHEIKQLHQLCPTQMHIVDVLQKIQDRLLKFFFGIIRDGHAHSIQIKTHKKQSVNRNADDALKNLIYGFHSSTFEP